MKKYKLIKEYPGSPKLGEIIKREYYGSQFELESNCRIYFPKNIIENYPEFWQEVIEKDYEILQLRTETYKETPSRFLNDKNLYILKPFPHDDGLRLDQLLGFGYYIYSVKRLSDGEIFTVGDIVNNGCNPNCIIKTLYISNNKLIVEMGKDGWQYINYIQKTKQPLFTTEDGVDIIDPKQICWAVYKFSDEIIGNNADYLNNFAVSSLKFSTKEKAEEYIIMNKPCLSINDLIQMNGKLRDGSQFNDQYFDNVRSLNELKNLVKTKLKND